jgi:Agenet domain/Caspase domain
MTRLGALTLCLPMMCLSLAACRSSAPPGPSPEATATTNATTATTSAATATPQSDAGLALAGPSVHAVIVGVLEFGEPGVAGWSKEKRKDQELYDTLVARGVPKKHIDLLLDDEAEHAAVFAALQAASRRAGPGDTLLFYYAGHGMRDSGGAPHFVAYDTKSRDLAGTGLAIATIGATVGKAFRGQRVIFMADACYSGSLAEAADTLAASGKVAVSLTSAEASNLSTDNWTFTQTVIDGLRGDPLMDLDADGNVALGEVAAAVADGMKYREKQRHGYHPKGAVDGLRLAKAATPAPKRGSGPLAVGRYVLADRDGKQQVAQIRARQGGQRVVRFYDYNHAEERTLAASELSPIRYERHAEGAALKVFWGNELYDAKVVRADGDFHFVTYPGWGPEWNEWVMSDRIAADEPSGKPGAGPAFAKGKRVEVEWRGDWWPATVRDRKGGRFLIHYVDYGDDWDEWVGRKRIRKTAAK